jgi:hypothetical protein
MASPQFQEWYEKFGSTGDICPIRLGMSRDEVRAIDELVQIYRDTPEGVVETSISRRQQDKRMYR